MKRIRRHLHGDPRRVRLGAQARATLRDDPRLLCDPRGLGELHARLAEGLGEEEAAAALLQAGFLVGLRDALHGLEDGWRADRPLAGPCAASGPRLPFAALASGADGGRSIDLTGCWHGGGEAEGRLAALGRSRRPSCFVSAGYTSGWLTGLLGSDVLAVETECTAAGAPRCTFRARAAQAWAGARERGARRALGRLDFADLRRRVEEPEPAAWDDDPDEMDPELPVVHVWGPVMVVPFAGPDDSISALDLIARDDAARDVSVVVVDLGGAILDTGFGALALERVLDAIERRGADAVLAGVCPLSEPVVAALEARHLLLHGELPAAIAAAFQIADAQQRVY